MKTFIETKLIQAEPCTVLENIDGGNSVYIEVVSNPHMRTNAPSVSQEMVDSFIAHTEVITMGDKNTVVRAVLKNGFEIVESSACVSAENYDEAYGAEICMKKIKDKVWMLLGFLLQTATHGITGDVG